MTVVTTSLPVSSAVTCGFGRPAGGDSDAMEIRLRDGRQDAVTQGGGDSLGVMGCVAACAVELEQRFPNKSRTESPSAEVRLGA